MLQLNATTQRPVDDVLRDALKVWKFIETGEVGVEVRELKVPMRKTAQVNALAVVGGTTIPSPQPKEVQEALDWLNVKIDGMPFKQVIVAETKAVNEHNEQFITYGSIMTPSTNGSIEALPNVGEPFLAAELAFEQFNKNRDPEAKYLYWRRRPEISFEDRHDGRFWRCTFRCVASRKPPGHAA